jgi:hypothetical protein
MPTQTGWHTTHRLTFLGDTLRADLDCLAPSFTATAKFMAAQGFVRDEQSRTTWWFEGDPSTMGEAAAEFIRRFPGSSLTLPAL